MISGDNNQKYIVLKVIESDNILYGKLGLFRDTYDILFEEYGN